jgi:hypothetical protein
LTFASTAISIYSICQIFATTKQVSATNEKVRLNSNTLEMHSALLVLNSIVTICYTVAYNASLRIYYIVSIVLVIADFLIQLFICYICVKLGANDSLNRLDCFLVDDGSGRYQIKFFMKKNVPEAIGVPHAANHASEEEEEDYEIDESVENSFTRSNALWRDRRRGMSFTNARECNEIVRQFLDIQFDESMIHNELVVEIETHNDTSVNMVPEDVD